MPHRVMPGNRPSNVLLAPKLTPSTLGQLVAVYEHRVLTQGVVWGLDSFDQWGVELGKKLATTIAAELESDDQDGTVGDDHDSSTRSLIRRYRRLR